jgi:D-sedoheptulose 7-phosphate isomerase
VGQRVAEATRAVAVAALARRVEAGRQLAAAAEGIAAACHDMAIRFHRGGRLIVFGNGAQATDAQHVSVEFVHPAIVGKRALPAMTLTGDVATITGVARRDGFAEVFAHQLRHLAAPDDIALGLTPDGRCENVRRGLETGRELGLLTVALAGGDGGDLAGAVDHLLLAASDDPLVAKEIHVTVYHILWELVHVFFEQPEVLGPGAIR